MQGGWPPCVQRFVLAPAQTGERKSRVSRETSNSRMTQHLLMGYLKNAEFYDQPEMKRVVSFSRAERGANETVQ
jgi:hypothetical protein